MYSLKTSVKASYLQSVASIAKWSFLNTIYILLHNYPTYKGAMIGALLQYNNCHWYFFITVEEQA